MLSSLLKCSVLFTGSAAAIYSLLLPYYLTYLGFLPLAWFLHPVNMATWLTNHHKHLPQADSVLCFLSPTARLTSISLAVPVPTQPFPGTTPPRTLGRYQEDFLPVVEHAALSAAFCGGESLKYIMCPNILVFLLLPPSPFSFPRLSFLTFPLKVVLSHYVFIPQCFLQHAAWI